MSRRNYIPKLTIHMMIGLPGSGKTHYVNKLRDDSLYSSLINICFDNYMDSNKKIKNLKEIFEKTFKYNGIYDGCDRVISLDGLFLTNDIRRHLLTELLMYLNFKFPAVKNMEIKIKLHVWNEDREACLHNDYGRRSESSESTIKNAVYEPINVDYILHGIKKHNNLAISITENKHTVIKATIWQKHFEDRISWNSKENENVMYSSHWSLGGTCGNCWDNHLTKIYPDESQEEFTEFDNLLEEICPNISFLQYKNVRSQCVSMDYYSEHDYYGGCVEYARWKCDLKKLYDVLEEKNLITEITDE